MNDEKASVKALVTDPYDSLDCVSISKTTTDHLNL